MKNFMIICAAMFLLFASAGCGGETSTENKPAEKSDENLVGQWSRIEKDSSGIVTAITILNIETEKSATLKTLTLVASKFSENEPVQIFWQTGDIQADINRSGKTLKFVAHEMNDVELLELNYDGQNLSSDKMTFTKENLDVENLKAQSISQYQANIGEKSEVIADMTQAEYKDYINQKVFGIR